jgi:hypothetical protein
LGVNGIVARVLLLLGGGLVPRKTRTRTIIGRVCHVGPIADAATLKTLLTAFVDFVNTCSLTLLTGLEDL